MRVVASARYLAAAAAALVTAAGASGALSCGGNRSALIFAYWTATEWRGLHLAASCDGLYYTALNDGRPILNATCGTMRDVYVHRGPDAKTFHLVSTGSCCPAGFNYWNTTDFLRFQHGERCWMASAWPNTTAVWAPEWTWVAARNAYLVFWSSETDGQPAEGPTGDNLRIYGAWSKDFQTPLEAPSVIFDPGYTVIDANIIQVSEVARNGRSGHTSSAESAQSVQFNLFFKDERGHNLAGGARAAAVPAASSTTGGGDACSRGAMNPSMRTVCPGWDISWDSNHGAGCRAHGCCFQPSPDPDPKHFPWCFANTSAPPRPQDKVVRRARSTGRADGGYDMESISEPISPEFSEGPEVVRAPTRNDSWILYYDCFEAPHYGLATSDDGMASWTVQQDCASGAAWKGYPPGINFPPGVRHGSFFYVTSTELAALAAAYPS